MPLAANTAAKILAVELYIAITAADTLTNNAVDFLTASIAAYTIVRCIEVEFYTTEQLHLRYPGSLQQSFIKPSGA